MSAAGRQRHRGGAQLCAQGLNLGLELLVAAEDAFDRGIGGGGGMDGFEFADLALEGLDVFLGALADVALRLTIVGAFASELGLGEMGHGAFPTASWGRGVKC